MKMMIRIVISMGIRGFGGLDEDFRLGIQTSDWDLGLYIRVCGYKIGIWMGIEEGEWEKEIWIDWIESKSYWYLCI